MLSVETRCIHFLTQLVLMACLGLTYLSVSPTAAAQEPEAPLEEVQQQWSELDSKLAAKEQELKSGEGDALELQKEYRDLLDQANEMIERLETAAIARLDSEPDNPAVVRTLMGILLNDAQQNRDAKALALGDTLIANGINPEYFEVASRSERLSIASREIFDELIIRHGEAMKADLPRVKLTTTQGDIVLEFFENEAPETVGNFISLVEKDYYTDLLFHRVIEGFMAQGGGFKLEDDKEVGGKGPGYEIKCECHAPDRRLHFSNSLSMAHRGKDTGGAQFFITFERTSFLDGKHTCFGRVIEGQKVLDTLTRTHISTPQGEQPIPGVTKDKIIKAEVIRKRDHKYRPNKVGGNDDEEEVEEKKEDAPTDDDADKQKADKENDEAAKTDKTDDSEADQSEADQSEADESKTADSKAESDSEESAKSEEEPTDDSGSETESEGKSDAEGDESESDADQN